MREDWVGRKFRDTNDLLRLTEEVKVWEREVTGWHFEHASFEVPWSYLNKAEETVGKSVTQKSQNQRWAVRDHKQDWQ